MAKYPGRAILVENSDYFQFDLPLNHFLKKKIKLKPVHRLVLVRLFYGKNLKKKKEEKNEALFINPLYSAGHNSHSSKTHCPAATQANLISTKSSPSLAFLSFFFHRNYQPYPQPTSSPRESIPLFIVLLPRKIVNPHHYLPHLFHIIHTVVHPVKASTPFSFKSRDSLPSYSD
jgi:hypothetical protein